MTSLLSYLPVDVQSLLPRASPQTAPLPSVGDKAPLLPASAGAAYADQKAGTVIAFVRHCGCPFAEKEVRLLSEAVAQTPGLKIVVVQHSKEEETQAWWQRIKGPELLPDAKLIADPERQVYADFGIGVLPWSGMFSRSMVNSLLERKKEGIVNTQTGGGSWRWQNSGGMAVDVAGTVKWVKVAQDAGDVCDYVAAAKALSQ